MAMEQQRLIEQNFAAIAARAAGSAFYPTARTMRDAETT